MPNCDHAPKPLETAQAQVNLANASVVTGTVQLGVIESQSPNVLIATPIDGTVEKITLNSGDLAQSGQTILSVNNLESVWVTANLEETKIGRIVVGVPLKIRFDAPLEGATLLPGMSVEVKIRTTAKLPAFAEGLHL